MNKKKVILISFNWANHFSLALGYLKAYALKDNLIRENTDIEIIDFDTEMLNVQQVIYYLSQTKPDILGFSCYCWNIEKVLDTCKNNQNDSSSYKDNPWRTGGWTNRLKIFERTSFYRCCY